MDNNQKQQVDVRDVMIQAQAQLNAIGNIIMNMGETISQLSLKLKELESEPKKIDNTSLISSMKTQKNI